MRVKNNQKTGFPPWWVKVSLGFLLALLAVPGVVALFSEAAEAAPPVGTNAVGDVR